MLKDELCLQAIKEIFPKDGPNDQMQKPKALKLLKYTWQNYYEMALHFAKALVAIGVEERSVVLIQGPNSPEHFACAMGTILANCIFSDIYPTNSKQVCLYQVRHSQAKVICVDTYARLKDKFLVNAKELVKLGVQAFVLFGEGLNSKD